MNQVDAILYCRWVIPVVPHNVAYGNHAIILNKGKIVAVIPQDQVSDSYAANHIRHLDDHAVLPGFVNAHTHSPMVLFKGSADDLPLMKWLNEHIWPAETKWLNGEFIQDGTELALAEMIKNGTTCFNEHYYFPEIMAATTKAAKMRACIGPTIINFPTNWSKDENDAFRKFQDFLKEYQRDPLLTISLAPQGPYSVTDQILEKIKGVANEHHLTIHMHVQETSQEVADSLQDYGKRPLQRLHDLGLLSDRFQCVHMTQMNDSDFELLKKTQAHVIHCPESNLKLASGYCPVDKLLQGNINVALGTDSAASNNNLDMIGEMRTAALIGKTVASCASAVGAAEVIRMATLNGAKAMGLADKIGSIEAGKAADLVAINLNNFNTRPLFNPISAIVYSAMNTQITDVWVAGVPILKDQTLQTLDEQELIAKAKKWQERLR